jgi:MoxR-like ATPase
LFLDELNASSAEVQKAFYSLILDRRIGEYELPAGSVVIGAGNRATDNGLARPMASALLNRLHVHLRASKCAKTGHRRLPAAWSSPSRQATGVQLVLLRPR